MRRPLGFALLALAAVSLGSSPGRADPVACAFTGTNGTQQAPYTYAGTVGAGSGQICQIGNVGDPSGSSTFVDSNTTPSIYSFYFGGGPLTVTFSVGADPSPQPISVQLFSIPTATSAESSGTLLAGSAVFTATQPSGPYPLFATPQIAAGYFAVDTRVGLTDPTFQINFATAVAEPASVATLVVGLAAVCCLRGRRRSTCAELITR